MRIGCGFCAGKRGIPYGCGKGQRLEDFLKRLYIFWFVLFDMGVIWFRLNVRLSRWHAEDAWLASLIIRAKQINGNYNPVAEAEAILAEAPVFA